MLQSVWKNGKFLLETTLLNESFYCFSKLHSVISSLLCRGHCLVPTIPYSVIVQFRYSLFSSWLRASMLESTVFYLITYIIILVLNYAVAIIWQQKRTMAHPWPTLIGLMVVLNRCLLTIANLLIVFWDVERVWWRSSTCKMIHLWSVLRQKSSLLTR